MQLGASSRVAARVASGLLSATTVALIFAGCCPKSDLASGGGSTAGPSGRSGPRIVAELVPDTDATSLDPLADSGAAIRSEIEEIRGHRHAKMPKAKKEKTGVIEDPVVMVRNLTRQPLTVWFSGECARKITVPPDARRSSVLCPGDYVTAARIDNPDIMPFLGDQLLEHGAQYTLSFFIAKKPTIERRKIKK